MPTGICSSIAHGQDTGTSFRLPLLTSAPFHSNTSLPPFPGLPRCPPQAPASSPHAPPRNQEPSGPLATSLPAAHLTSKAFTQKISVFPLFQNLSCFWRHIRFPLLLYALATSAGLLTTKGPGALPSGLCCSHRLPAEVSPETRGFKCHRCVDVSVDNSLLDPSVGSDLQPDISNGHGMGISA